MTTTERLLYALTDLDDLERKEGRLLSLGDVEYALSDTQGNMEAGTIDISLSDLYGRPIGSRLEVSATRNFQRDEIAILALTDAGRRASLTPATLGRALIQDTAYGTPVVAKFSGTDPLFCDGGAFSQDKQFPTWTIPSYYVNAPADVSTKPMLVIFELSDEGATDPVTNLPSARGLVGPVFVGMDGLATGPGGAAEPWGRFHVCLFASYKLFLYGSDFGGGISGRSGHSGATSDGADPNSVITLAGSPDLSSVSVDGDMAITLYTPSQGKQERQIIAKTSNTVTINNSLAAADCTDVDWVITTKLPQRTKIDCATRNGDDVMVFGYAGYVRSTPYEDIMGSDGEVYRETPLWIRGPLLDAHLAGEITIGANVIGVEDKGDGSGLPIRNFFTAYHWWLENGVLRNSKAPNGPGGLWPATDGDLVAYADGTYAIKGSTFVAAQAQTAASFGGAGFQVSGGFDTQMGMRDAIARWNTNGQCRLGVNEHGQVFVWKLDVMADSSTWPRVEHVSRVFGDVQRTNPQTEMENVVQGTCDWDSDGQRYRNALVTIPSPAGITHNKGVKKFSAVLEGTLTRDPRQWAFVLNERLAAQQDGPIEVTFPGDVGLMDYPIGSGILFTSIMGPGALGFVDQPLWIVKKRFAIDTHLVTLTCLQAAGGIPFPLPVGTVASDFWFLLDDETSSPRALGDEGSTVTPPLVVPPITIQPPVVSVGLPVVPGGFGFGMETRAAYGGFTAPTILRVTTLLDAGAGSLRAALEASGPRVVVFETSGTISLASDIYITSPYITVAGQTAPSPGVTLRYYSYRVQTHDVLVQHLRVRGGGTTCNNCIQVFNQPDAYRIVFDHVSASWGQDENWVMQNPSRSLEITVWRCITSESLQLPPVTGCGGGTANSHGMLIYAGARHVAVIQTLFAQNVERNPYMQNDTSTVLLNNLIYQWSGAWAFFYGNHSTLPGGPWFSTVVGNRNISGPATADMSNPAWHWFFFSDVSTPGDQLYRHDNTLDDAGGFVVEELSQLSYSPDVGSPPAEAPMPAGYTPMASTAVEAYVLAHAGCRPLDRDSVDTRIVAEVTARSGGFISSETDVGGWPALAVNVSAFVAPANPHVDAGAGYTNLEVALHVLAAALEP